MLKGGKGFAYDYNFTSKLFEKIELKDKYWLMEDVEKFQIEASNLITGLEYATEDGSTSVSYGVGKKGKRASQIPVHSSFKTPDTICLTRTSNDAPDSLRVYDLVVLNR